MKKSMQETFQSPPFNRDSIIGFIAAILTVISFCVGVIPVPFTALICYPVNIVAGIFTLVTGLKALRQIRQLGERGRALALISAWTGGVIIFAVLCVITLSLGILLFPFLANFIKIPWPTPINPFQAGLPISLHSIILMRCFSHGSG
jgi:hypothetical protein